jgi:hypothetical protein
MEKDEAIMKMDTEHQVIMNILRKDWLLTNIYCSP